MEIIPALMPKNYNEITGIGKQFQGLVTSMQIDVMDGVYVTGKTWPFLGDQYANFAQIKENGLPHIDNISYELDLMVLDPMHDIDTYLDMNPSRIIFHATSCDLLEVIEYKKSGGFGQIKIGVAFQIDDDIVLYSHILHEFDFIQCMGILTIGKQGEVFNEQAIKQIDRVHAIVPDMEISVDGGITPQSLSLLQGHNVGRVVSGSFLLKAENKEQAIAELKDVI